jgi:hypothetical protein
MDLEYIFNTLQSLSPSLMIMPIWVVQRRMVTLVDGNRDGLRAGTTRERSVSRLGFRETGPIS